MELGSVFLILAVLIMVGMYVYAPFMMRARRLHAGETLQVSALKAERDRIINALQELDFDYNLGKIPVDDYPEQRASLLQKGANILRQLDELAPVASSASDVEVRIEKAAAAARADSSAQAEPPSDDDLESMIAARRREHTGKSAGFCPKCGKPIWSSDKFCPSCGKSLQ